MPRATAWTKRWCQEQCHDYRGRLLAFRTATPEEIADYWPGGAQNPFRGKGAWFWTHAQLIRMVGRRQHQDVVHREALIALGKSARREPQRVQCSDGVERFVHCKSYPALAFLDALKIDLAVVNERRAMELKGAPQLSEALLAPLVTSLCYRLFAWVVTHPDVGLPFSLSEEAPDPPTWTEQLTPEDLFLLATAHLDVNRRRLELCSAISPADGKPSILPIEGWVAAYAHEKGRSTFEMLDRWSLGELYAQAVSATIAAEEHAPPPAPSAGDQRMTVH